MEKHSWRLAIVGVALLTTMWAGAPTAHSRGGEQHCLVRLTGEIARTGELKQEPMRCFTTVDEILVAIGGDVVDPRTTDGVLPSPNGTSSVLGVLGVHYEDHEFEGDSFWVSGDVCTGGWINVADQYNDWISSTANGCPRVRHREHANLQGATFDTFPCCWNITGVMDDETTSIQYLGS